jgi:hypothetical protein
MQKENSRMEQKMWVYMLQLGTNMWRKKNRQSSRKMMDEEAYYRDYLNCDRETWRKVTEFLPSCGVNTLLIDMGEGVKLDRHPELAVEGSWSKEEFRRTCKITFFGINTNSKIQLFFWTQCMASRLCIYGRN